MGFWAFGDHDKHMHGGRRREPSRAQNKGCGWLPQSVETRISRHTHLLIFLMIERWRVVCLLIVTHQERVSLASCLPLSLVSNWSGLMLHCKIYDDCVSLERWWWRHISEERSGAWSWGQEAQSVIVRRGLCLSALTQMQQQYMQACRRAHKLRCAWAHIHTHISMHTCPGTYLHEQIYINTHRFTYTQKETQIYAWVHG